MVTAGVLLRLHVDGLLDIDQPVEADAGTGGELANLLYDVVDAAHAAAT